MKFFKNKTGPFPIRLWLDDSEIESAAAEQMHKARIYPSVDKPFVDVDKILEKNFSVSPHFESLDDGVLGATEFFTDGSVRVIIAKKLGEQSNASGENLYRTTLAHELGHAVLHRILFLDDTLKLEGIKTKLSEKKYPVLCRSDRSGQAIKAYDGDWWEWQANRFMSALLMPKQPTIKMCEELRSANPRATTSDLKQLLIQRMSTEMKVSRQACEIRLQQLKICQADEKQIELAI